MGEDENPNGIVVVKGQWPKVDSSPGFFYSLLCSSEHD
jgi:hypothetical protein